MIDRTLKHYRINALLGAGGMGAAAYAARALEQDSQNYVGIFLRGLVASKRGDI